jgi:hypothetical protein
MRSRVLKALQSRNLTPNFLDDLKITASSQMHEKMCFLAEVYLMLF